MRFDVVATVPECFAGWLDSSIIGRARAEGLLVINVWDLRDFATDKHRMVDDYPYGGGAGMVLKPEPLFRAVETLLQQAAAEGRPAPEEIILLTPQGRPLTQAVARELASASALLLLCGRYEGVDERVREGLVTQELSIGDYVLTGGELPAMVVMEAVARLLPGVLGDEGSAQDESFTERLLEYPHYTRPATFRDRTVPEVLLSGHHEHIRLWRRQQSLLRTLERRPDLLAQHVLTEEDRRLLARVV
jgi:tRNA (guanine37-N1)-methyltransferase